MSISAGLDQLLVVFALAAALQDLAVRRISNRVVLSGMLSAVLIHLLSALPWRAVDASLAGALTGLLLFLPLYLLRGMAAGDVKLMAMVGSFIGPQGALQIAAASCLIGGVQAFAIVVARGKLAHALGNLRALLRPLLWRLAGVPLVAEPLGAHSVGGMPYGPAIALGTLLVAGLRHA